jgi:class 3 adenylate cyclase
MGAERNLDATMDLGGWLRKLGLGQCEAAFRENAIDDTVLPSLTAEDLKDLGVIIVGHRRKLLDAIAALRGPNAKAPAPDTLLATDGIAHDIQRRQVTVMFSDLVGSAALSEDLREVISAYQKCVAEAVHRFDGFVAKYLGDGVLVYFGYPQAHSSIKVIIVLHLPILSALSALLVHSIKIINILRLGILSTLISWSHPAPCRQSRR